MNPCFPASNPLEKQFHGLQGGDTTSVADRTSSPFLCHLYLLHTVSRHQFLSLYHLFILFTMRFYISSSVISRSALFFMELRIAKFFRSFKLFQGFLIYLLFQTFRTCKFRVVMIACTEFLHEITDILIFH